MTPAGTSPPSTQQPTATRREQVFPARPDQVREARRFLASILHGSPLTDDAVLCLDELASNAVLHSNSSKASGTFTARVEVFSDYVWIEVEDDGGLWQEHAHHDGRPHGLDIIRALAADWGVDGDPLTGWTVWARLPVV
jgi:serine/threonine-protein kinase RsbW